MYSDIYDVIGERLTELGLENVDTALGDQPPLPAVQPFFSEDKELAKKPVVIRGLTYMVKVTVGHNETPKAAQTEMLGLLDTIRDGFADWRPDDLVGVQGSFSVLSVQIADFKDHGRLEYLVFLRLRVNPKSFKRN